MDARNEVGPDPVTRTEAVGDATDNRKVPHMTGNGKTTAVLEPTNDASFHVDAITPYVASLSIEGSAPLLCHRWSCDDIEAKAKAAKNSASKKVDNVESYVYRDTDGRVSIPGEYLRMAVVGAGRYRQDPRSPRKSAMDLFKAAVVPVTEYAPIYSVSDPNVAATTWDYLDRRRVTVQRNGVTRVRPAFLAGWRCDFDLQVITPEYLEPMTLLAALTDAGRLIGIGDFRPTFGRFQVTRYELATG
jgi:hypothetical protein